MTSREIRQQFLDFFAGKAHTIVPSSPVVPADDPTLMFTNAGMNQFKDVFLGTGSRPYTRAADSQKCIRAGGKHNDLDDVGQDTYHHTFFEMLGNWSFGDYFKAEAIAWAWELLTGVWGIDKTRLHATYFEGDAAEGLEPDSEAARLWRDATDIDPSHIHPGSKKDNFWEMGDTGPCGPCSEIHIDLTPDKSGGRLVNAGDARVMEIWNLVFIQYNRAADGKLSPLPARHVDTGMGFERLCSVLQGMRENRLGQVSNYDTDVFAPLFAAIRTRCRAPEYRGMLPKAGERGSKDRQVMVDVTYRVIADHVRCLTFALTDGAVPSNEGRGYVLRRILRRAVRYGRQYFDMHEPFLCDLVTPLVAHMGDAFPELRSAHGGRNVEHVVELVREEEQSFGRTLERGMQLFDTVAREVESVPKEVIPAAKQWADVAELEQSLDGPRDGSSASSDPETEKDDAESRSAPFDLTPAPISPQLGKLHGEIVRAGGRIPGRQAFTLHDTFGFDIELTRLMAAERGLEVDLPEYQRLMDKARERARTSSADSQSRILDEWYPQAVPVCDDSRKYDPSLRCSATILMLHHRGPTLAEGSEIVVMTDRTCFYAEQGGQASDTGVIQTETGEVRVTMVGRVHGNVAHVGVLDRGTVAVGQGCSMRVGAHRLKTMKNHTATHMLNWALREVLGAGVQQKGSLVDAEKTRFDFSHNKPMTPEEIARTEDLVNQQIAADLPVYVQDVPQDKARQINTLRAVFGEKYPDVVRVVSVGAPIDEMLARPDAGEWMTHAVEFCGGTHLARSGQAERFALISEEGVAKGIRRVVGITGEAAKQAEAAGAALAARCEKLAKANPADVAEQLPALQREAAEAVIPLRAKYDVQARIAELQKIAKQAEKQQAAASGEAVMDRVAGLLSAAETVGGVTVVVGDVPLAPADALRGAIDWIRQKTPASAILLAMAEEGKVTLVAGMSRDVVARGVKAGDLIKEIAPLVGGRGGGRPDMAQGGGTDPSALPKALEAATAWIRQRLA
ncbi:MAG: alanine--tRNA ligase [Phycisphaerae bacterium]|nr:alanine--tRNA ligase [Phycisphaerae bacterium]